MLSTLGVMTVLVFAVATDTWRDDPAQTPGQLEPSASSGDTILNSEAFFWGRVFDALEFCPGLVRASQETPRPPGVGRYSRGHAAV
jgi:hypothetical protein